ncbi:enhancer of split mbeta protein [Leptinotarsa decemlineata]|uniref:Enhancer of split mgamma protein 1 n=1 Tax=Leptinotarsa decemlineata TaxID=7539 RepID=A0A0F7IIM4_LEPDE|nr:enhancer of split mbeta protein-like [Leptinotarsa decemlineata]AKG92756.1 enhancer of split mgamma protein 1 [Leptinotarsa decemlineata]
MSYAAVQESQPISRTLQYRKVMKPMLERKRRARINRCLDELKDLMVSALATDGDNVSKLEKADILELTVSHLQKLKRQQRLSVNPVVEADRFRAGFTTCAKEVSKCLASTPGVDVHLGTKLMTHLGHSLKGMDRVSPLSVPSAYTPPASPVYDEGIQYHMPPSPSSSSRSSPSPINYSVDVHTESVWRPW